MLSNHLILCHPHLPSRSIFPSIGVFSNESALLIRWTNYWTSSFFINLSNEHPELISFRMDLLDLLAVQRNLKSLLQHPSSKSSILQQYPYKTTGKTTALTRQIFVDKVMSLLFNMMSTLVITFLPKGKYLLISWLLSPSEVISEPKEVKSVMILLFPLLFGWSDGTRYHHLSFLNVDFQVNVFTTLFHFHQEAL